MNRATRNALLIGVAIGIAGNLGAEYLSGTALAEHHPKASPGPWLLIIAGLLLVCWYVMEEG